MTNQSTDTKSLQLTTQQKLGILLSFSKDKIVEQIQCVWFIILYLIVFQVLVLGLPIVYSLMIAAGIMIVIVGLAFFMEGLRLGLMPLGETLGSTLPRKKILGIPCLPASLAFGFVLGAFATFAEPAIGVLRAAGAGVDPTAAPLLWTILNTGAGLLVNCVGVGVGSDALRLHLLEQLAGTGAAVALCAASDEGGVGHGVGRVLEIGRASCRERV